MSILIPCPPVVSYFAFSADTSSCDPGRCVDNTCSGCQQPECAGRCCCGASVSSAYLHDLKFDFCADLIKVYISYAEADNYGSVGGVQLPTYLVPGKCYYGSKITQQTEISFAKSGTYVVIPYSVQNDTTSCGPWGGLFIGRIISICNQ